MSQHYSATCFNACQLVVPWDKSCPTQTTYSLTISSQSTFNITTTLNTNPSTTCLVSSAGTNVSCATNSPINLSPSPHAITMAFQSNSNTTFHAQLSVACANMGKTSATTDGLLTPSVSMDGSAITMSLPLFIVLLVISACFCGFCGFIFLHTLRCLKCFKRGSSFHHESVKSTDSSHSSHHSGRAKASSPKPIQHLKISTSKHTRDETPESESEDHDLALDPLMVRKVNDVNHAIKMRGSDDVDSHSHDSGLVSSYLEDGIIIASAIDTENELESRKGRRSTTAFTTASDDTFVCHPERDTMGSFPVNQFNLQSVVEDLDSDEDHFRPPSTRKTVTV